jgi:hypothetical protein
MRLTKANIAGLTSSLQQAEMKSILAGAWPPLKPLPVFKYETVEYRATIDFDKKRGEWVCRKTSLPSNTVQELRGGLREITLALPHDEGEVFTEDAEQQEQEVEKDMNRRLQAIHDWRENYESGALYFELRDHLAESQQTEVDDSLRLSLTARQLQFNPKNVAYVFDALSTAGGRFATLIEFAKRKRAKQGTEPQAQGQGATSEAERAIDHDEQSQGNSSREFEGILDNRIVRDQEAAEHCTDSDELPALSIKSVLPEQEQTSLAERMAPHRASQPLESEISEIVDTDSASLVEHPYQEGQHPPAFTGFAAQVQTGEASAKHSESSSSRFPVLEISAFHVAVFAALFLSAVFAFTVWLTVGRGPLASRLREAPKSILAMDAKSPTLPDPTDESTSRISAPTVKSANESGSTSRLGEATPPERKSEENTRGSEDFAKARSTDADSSEPTLSAKGEVSLAHRGAIGPGSSAPRRLIPTISATPSLPRSSTILVTRPGRGSQPFRVSFPEKTIAATSSLAMSSQLSVLVSAEPGLRVAHKPARLEAGDLVSFVWPRYPRPGDRNGLAETIRVRATIGQLGQVREVKFLSGSNSLLPATKAAIRQWRYRPTLLDKRPVPAQQDVTIEFRPPQYSSRVSKQHPTHN